MYMSTRRCCYLILKVIRALWGETLIDTLTKETDMNNEPTLDDVFAVAAENNANIDLSSIFPGPGTYLVKADAAIPGLNRTEPDHHRPYLRVPLTIEAAVDDETSKLVGRSFSIFLSLDSISSSKDVPAPITFTARSLYRLMTSSFAKSGDRVNQRVLREWVDDLDGMSFYVTRKTVTDAKGTLRARDTMISTKEYLAARAEAVEHAQPEPTPEQIAEAIGA